MNDNDAAEEQKERGKSQPWLQMVKDAEKAFEVYQENCTKIDKRYGDFEQMAKSASDREFQIFWANMEVLKPTIYQRPPRPVVMPRHNDTGNVVRKASELMERVLEVDVELDDVHDTMLLVRDDLATAARGVPWVLDNGHCIHVDRQDFVHEPARKWQEVGWVARRAYLTKEQWEKRFEGVEFSRAQAEEQGGKREDGYRETKKTAEVWELWSRSEQKVVWVTEGIDEVLDEQPPLFDVKGFFPCPRPAYGTLERGTLKPVPDYVYYRDQVEEINELTARIGSLADSLRLKGFYASGTSEVGEAIETAMKQTSNKAILVPVSSVAALGGNLKDAIIWLPVRDVAEVIASCVELRRQLIEDVYEITGLSDIMRGVSEANETATAQNIKAQYGSIRIRERQNEMVRVSLEVLRIKGEIYAEQSPIQDLAQMAGMQIPTAQQLQQAQMRIQQMMQAGEEGQAAEMQQALAGEVPMEQIDALLKNQKLRPFLLEIETDSTIAPNEQAEKESRMEFITAVGGFIQQAGAMVAQSPETAPFMAELLKFTAGGFRAGRDLGGAIDEFAEQVKKKAAMAGKQPSPEQIQAQAEAEAKKMEFQIKQGDQQLKAQELQVKAQETQASMAMQAQKDQADLALKQFDLALKGRELGLKVDDQMLKERQAELDAIFKMEEIDIEREQERAARIGDSE